jgi:transcriptional regulator with XRE-family HTH domain/gamma-glutamylcyclotransferase (GGCT)/AIG2-like uncharacterized protein YtfP
MNQEQIGKFIKELRIKNNLTQAEFASLFGVTYQAVSKWENGKNIPDIEILKQISEHFNINIEEILNGKSKSKRKKIHIIPIVIIILIIVSVLILILFNKNTFEFRTISTTCSDFTIQGSIAYDKNKTSLYISSIDYCGIEEDTFYDSIECNLYESDGDTITKINSCEKKEDITLEKYLKDVKINVDHYSKSCPILTGSDLYLEITAIKNDKTTTYKIPINLDEKCS